MALCARRAEADDDGAVRVVGEEERGELAPPALADELEAGLEDVPRGAVVRGARRGPSRRTGSCRSALGGRGRGGGNVEEAARGQRRAASARRHKDLTFAYMRP